MEKLTFKQKAFTEWETEDVCDWMEEIVHLTNYKETFSKLSTQILDSIHVNMDKE